MAKDVIVTGKPGWLVAIYGQYAKDTATGERYKQMQYPQGNNWVVMEKRKPAYEGDANDLRLFSGTTINTLIDDGDFDTDPSNETYLLIDDGDFL